MAAAKEANDLKIEQQARELEKKIAHDFRLMEETEYAKKTIAHWENKATTALTELEKKNRELAEATEDATSLKVQIASAVARAEHAEQNLRQQTELLDEMAELAAEKEATLAQVVTLRQESDARALEIDLLSSDARLSSEAAAMWEARAKAAEKLVDERARVAEEAAAAVKMAADERLRVLEDDDGRRRRGRTAVAAEVRAEAIAADAELKSTPCRAVRLPRRPRRR